jgi:hypothetical protein
MLYTTLSRNVETLKNAYTRMKHPPAKPTSLTIAACARRPFSGDRKMLPKSAKTPQQRREDLEEL